MMVENSMGRRAFLRLLGAFGSFAAMAGAGRAAFAQKAETAAEEPPRFTFEERLEQVLAGRMPKAGRVVLNMPEIAEDGTVVPVEIRVESPMTPRDHVRRLTLLVDHNPDPLIFSAELHPSLGRVVWKLKIRMAETSAVRAIAEMNDGNLYIGQVEVDVISGGCG